MTLSIPTLTPILDPTGFQITPTLHTFPNDTIEPSKATLSSPYTVCILGASRGIGAFIAYAYALAGASNIIIAARNLPSLEAVALKITILAPMATVVKVICDVSSAQSMAALAEKVKGEVGRLDAVIVNAAYYGPMVTSITAGEPSDFRRVVDTNVLGTYHAAHFLIPLLLDTEGGAKAFVAISSLGAWMVGGEIAHTAACMSKLAQVRLVEMIDEEFKEQGILAVAIHPGFVATEMSEVVTEEWRKNLTDEPGLCGAFCVWLTKTSKDRYWLSGRFLSAKWDVDQLLAMKDAIIGKDMLKSRMVVS